MRKVKKSLVGKTFGEWRVLHRVVDVNRPSGAAVYWLCQCSCKAIKMVEHGSLIRKQGSKSCGHRKRFTGALSPSWKGGRYISSTGYVVIQGTKVRGNRTGRSLEHRAIFEKFLGRKLRRNEHIHHKNGCRADNRIENLELWSTAHPRGARVEDLIKWAKEILSRYETPNRN